MMNFRTNCFSALFRIIFENENFDHYICKKDISF